MRFTTLGNKNNPTVLFFHAMGVTGESSEAVGEILKDKYFIVMPTLSAYCKGQVMVSKQDELLQLKKWLEKEGIEKIELMVASSLGADFAMSFLTSSNIPVKKVFFDGGQFARIGKTTRKIMVPFLYLAIKSLYWSKGGTLKNILWCDDKRIQPYFIEAGKGLDYTSLRHMMRDCLTDDAYLPVDEQIQKNIIFEFGSIEEHFKYRDAVMQAYPEAIFPVFKDMNHMQIQIRHPEEFANILKMMMKTNETVLKTQEYTETDILELSKELS